MTPHPPPRLLVRLGALQARHPWYFVAVALVSLLPSLWATLGLGFKSDFAELLPDNKDSVIEARRVAKRLPGVATLTIVAEVQGGPHASELQSFVNALVPRLEALGPAKVGAIDFGTQEARRFFDQNKLLYADLANVRKADAEITERYNYEIAKAQGTLLDDEDPPPPLTAASIKARLRGDTSGDTTAPSEIDATGGYYMNKAATYIAVLVRTPVEGKAATAALRRDIENAVAATKPASFEPSMRISYTGDLITTAEEYDAVVRDLGEVGAWGVVGVLGSVLLFFLRVRTVLTMGAALLVALLWTFGLTRFTIGYLNSSTGFLVSIIAGNGINYGIMYMARYVEARRDEGLAVTDAIAVAHRDSWLPTLASAATAMLAYGSLIVTDFRGFKHFGIIGSYGMLLCWVATYVFMPAILAASESVWPAYRPRPLGAPPTRARGYYGYAFAKLTRAFPRGLTLVGTVGALVCLALSAKYLLSDPMEYDMRKVRNERKGETNAGVLQDRVDDVVGRLGQDGMAIMTDRLDQVPMLETALMQRYDAAPAALKPFEKVVTIFSLLPRDQETKTPLINEMRDRILRAKSRGFLSSDDWAELAPNLPTHDVRPITIADLPEQVARPFTERDGTRGRIVYIVPKSGFSVWDATYLMRWADSFRYTKLPTGEVIKGSGRAVIFADMIKTVGEDAPKAIAFAALGSILVIIVAFRARRQAWGVFLPWLVGVAGLLAFLELKGIKLSFLSFVAIPITIGIGAEYAHNLMQRYRVEGDGNIYHVVIETGGAVVLCSMTTTIGYLALMLSINKGIVGFGLAAAAGEISCVVAAVLFLPAFLVWRAQRRRARMHRAAASLLKNPPTSRRGSGGGPSRTAPPVPPS